MAKTISFMLCVFPVIKIWVKGWDFSSRFWFSFLLAPAAWASEAWKWPCASHLSGSSVITSRGRSTHWLWFADCGPFLAHAAQGASPLFTGPLRCRFQGRLDLGPEQCVSLPRSALPWAPFSDLRGSGGFSLHFILLCFKILFYLF